MQQQDLVTWLIKRPLISSLLSEINCTLNRAEVYSILANAAKREIGGLYGIEVEKQELAVMYREMQHANVLYRKLQRTLKFYIQSL